MRIVIDECVDPRVKGLFGDHTTVTVFERGWNSLDDGALLDAAQHEFDVLLTIDGGLEFQQNLAKFDIAVVVVRVSKNQLPQYTAKRTEILDAIARARPGAASHV